MQRPTILYLLFLLLALTLSACSSAEEEQRRSSFLTAVRTNDAQQQLVGLYHTADEDLQVLSRILRATPSVIERIRTGKSHPTPHFAQHIHAVSRYYVEHDEQLSNVRAAFDPAYGLGHAFFDFCFQHRFLVFAFNLLLLLFTNAMKPLHRNILAGVIVAFYLALGLSIWIGAPKPVADPYIHTLHHQLEQLSTSRPAR